MRTMLDLLYYQAVDYASFWILILGSFGTTVAVVTNIGIALYYIYLITTDVKHWAGTMPMVQRIYDSS